MPRAWDIENTRLEGHWNHESLNNRPWIWLLFLLCSNLVKCRSLLLLPKCIFKQTGDKFELARTNKNIELVILAWCAICSTLITATNNSNYKRIVVGRSWSKECGVYQFKPFWQVHSVIHNKLKRQSKCVPTLYLDFIYFVKRIVWNKKRCIFSSNILFGINWQEKIPEE